MANMPLSIYCPTQLQSPELLPVKAEFMHHQQQNQERARHVGLAKPWVTLKQQDERYIFALTCKDMQQKDWYRIIFSREIHFGRHGYEGRIWVTRRAREEQYAQPSHRPSSICGVIKGPLLCWDKAWGSITAALYTEHIVRLIEQFYTEQPELATKLYDNLELHGPALQIWEVSILTSPNPNISHEPLNMHATYPCNLPYMPAKQASDRRRFLIHSLDKEGWT